MGDRLRSLGLDIGGANLKAATADGFAIEAPFPLWQQPVELAWALSELITQAPEHGQIAVTMTGELADCYATKAQGVRRIVEAVVLAASGKPLRFYAMPRRFLSAEQAIDDWRSAAASNWAALWSACNDASAVGGTLVIDIGSTTTDIITGCDPPRDDTQRLLTGELVYLGVGRTPLCAVIDALPYRVQMCGVAAELFATTADVMMMLGLCEPSETAPTADGRPLSVDDSRARLARMLCADTADFTQTDAETAAAHVWETMVERVAVAISGVLAATPTPSRCVVSGSGVRLAEAALARSGAELDATPLELLIGADAARCAPAWAVAKLADEEAEG